MQTSPREDLVGTARWGLCKTMLLGMVTIAMVIPGSDVAFSQNSAGSLAQASLFTAIELHPSGFVESEARGISGGQQVGDILVPPGTGEIHAVLWRGSADRMVDLHPRGFPGGSEALAVCGGQQVGAGFLDVGGNRILHALLWRGSAASVVDLHPRGFQQSLALGTSGDQQVGEGDPSYLLSHAVLWRGSAATVVDLHPRGFERSDADATSGDQQVGRGVNPDPANPGGSYSHALLWRGSARSAVDLHPRGFTDSWASGVSGSQQVGVATNSNWDSGHAMLWRGSAASVVDLNPLAFTYSWAHGTNGEEQVGSGVPQGAAPLPGAVGLPAAHALLWRGSAASVVDLHAFLPPGFVESTASSINAAGDIVGEARDATVRQHAFLWKRNVPRPGAPREQSTMRC